MTTLHRPLVHPRAAAAVASLLLAVAGGLALRQRNLLDPARSQEGAIAAARLLHERQRYGPGDPGEFDRLLRERGVDEADRVFRALTELAPTWGAYRYALGLAPLTRGEWDVADERFRQARTLSPNDVGLAERIGAAWVRTAAEHKAPQLLLYAMPCFADAARLDPVFLRQTLRLLQPFGIEVRELSRIVPDTPQGAREFGMLLAEAGLADEAIAPLSRAVRDAACADEAAWLALGRCHLSLGHVEEAEAAFRESVASSSDPTAAVRSLYEVFGAAGRARDGVNFWERLADAHPRGARFNLGRVQFDRGPDGYAGAFDQFQAIEDVAHDPSTTGYLARIEIARGLFTDARARLERALRLHARDADLHYLMAQTLRGLRDAASARTELERARELSPSNETFVRLLDAWDREDQRNR